MKPAELKIHVGESKKRLFTDQSRPIEKTFSRLMISGYVSRPSIISFTWIRRAPRYTSIEVSTLASFKQRIQVEQYYEVSYQAEAIHKNVSDMMRLENNSHGFNFCTRMFSNHLFMNFLVSTEE